MILVPIVLMGVAVGAVGLFFASRESAARRRDQMSNPR
jgi:hypothetical protein